MTAMTRFPDPDVLMDEARRQTGFSDFGPGDFRPNLARLLDDVAREGLLTEAGTANVLNLIRRRLANRLEIEENKRIIEEAADVYAFLGHFTGLDLGQ